ncbi:thiopeptide-type bacteriocin biosynthesis protein [Chryseobacterium hagamense]|uniref:Thiopeptide-type bacteriocin biosynthesis domain-containing protein n=1 Tax=Chryseobacterium hagamense TaxID=395935 RepID=A0A511YSQ8_9FLAO|nr:thiopeptide-type bacteriocin biosynthesis protein [Chryseobacterium hagamense]GEN78223.1 hypothetical protein CHA01nite_39630 [Chryseobacterium hagamense]
MTKRIFPVGSEWLYLKIYTGVKTADIILEEAIHPLIECFKRDNYISKWFFIRYNDPKSHLRLRFKLSNNKYYNEVLNKINNVFQQYIESGEISNMLVDTYNQEIERYGQNTIEEAETLFYINSEFILHCLDYEDEEKIMVSLFYINQVLNKLGLSTYGKLKWIKSYNNAFKNEFNADKRLNSQLNKKYKLFKLKYSDFINSDEFFEEKNAIFFNIEKGDLALQNIIYHDENQSLGFSLQSFFQSIFHMNINRLFASNQRLFEMVIYDYLVKYYKTEDYIQKKIFCK